MPVWKEAKGWRYRFQYQGQKVNKAWFKTKAEARAAEAAHKAELKKTPHRTAMVFSEVANEYLDYSKRRHAIKTYKYKAFVFREFLSLIGELEINHISLSVLESYLKTRHSNHNYNVHRKELCALLAWAWKRRYIHENPCFFLEKLPEKRTTKQIPTPEEMSKIILASGADRLFILTLYHTLARLDEVLRLRWEDVNFTERTIRLWNRKRKDGSWASDIIPMNQVLYDTLRSLWAHRKSEDIVFLNPKTNSRYMRRPKLMRGICQRAGVRHFGFHAIRHYVASLLHDKAKVSLPQVSKLLRHQSKATTERYLQVVDQASRDALQALESTHLPIAPSHKAN